MYLQATRSCSFFRSAVDATVKSALYTLVKFAGTKPRWPQHVIKQVPIITNQQWRTTIYLEYLASKTKGY